MSRSNGISTHVDCPVCSEGFDQKDINAHVNECLNKSLDTSSEPITTRKRKINGTEDGHAWGSLKQIRTEENSKDKVSNATRGSFFKRKRIFKNSEINPQNSSINPSNSMQTEEKSPIPNHQEVEARSAAKVNKPLPLITKQDIASPSKDEHDDDSKINIHTETNDTGCASPELQDKCEPNGTKSRAFVTESVDVKEIKKDPLTLQETLSEKQKSAAPKFMFGQRTTTNKTLSNAPLAEQMRPTNFDEYVGQDHAVGENSMLRCLLESGEVPSLILWGPPGCGKVF